MWIVTTADQRLALPDLDARSSARRRSEPVGLQHAAAMGAPRTVCGRSTIDWHFFRTMQFPARFPSSCPRCLQEVMSGRTYDDGGPGGSARVRRRSASAA